MKMFITFFVILTVTLTYIMGKYYSMHFRLTHWRLTLFWIIHGIASLSLIVAPIVYRQYPERNSDSLQILSYIFFSFYSLLMIFTFVSAITSPVLNQAIKHDPLKREFFSRSLAIFGFGASGVLTLIGYVKSKVAPRIIKQVIPLKNLAPSFDQLSLVMISDLHIGQTIKKDYVQEVVTAVNSLNPDFIIVTGDMVDGLVDQLKEDTTPLRHLKAKHKILYAPGNHEYYWGLESWMREFEDIGFHLLLNQHYVFKIGESQLVFGGIHDYAASRFGHVSDVNAAFANSPSDACKILLAHQPRSIYDANKAGVDLQLSGHTHAGQFFPFTLLIHFFQPFIKGLNHYEGTSLYINQGTGYWGPPNRLGTDKEITHIVLKSEQNGPKA